MNRSQSSSRDRGRGRSESFIAPSVLTRARRSPRRGLLPGGQPVDRIIVIAKRTDGRIGILDAGLQLRHPSHSEAGVVANDDGGARARDLALMFGEKARHGVD